MKLDPWQWLKTFPGLLAASRPEPTRLAERIVAVQCRVVLPVRVGVLAVVLYYVFSTGWGPPSTETVILETIRGFFVFYLVCNALAGAIFSSWKIFPPGLFQWLVFVLGLLDGLFAGSLVYLTEGWPSVAFWLFPILIMLNAISIPLATPQIALNLLLSVFYFSAGILYTSFGQAETPLMFVPGQSPPHYRAQTNTVAGTDHEERTHPPIHWNSSPGQQGEDEASPEPVVLRLFVLVLLTLCCYGVQALTERQRRDLEDAREFAMREGQLQSAGRLAAEFAHQIKNPLAVIANATYSLKRSLRENKNSAEQQIEIIQEEVARADRVITQIMGYAQLSEGRVEKLDVVEELDRAIAQVFPPAVPTEIKIHRHYADYFPPLLMQRIHLSEIFVNLLKNAREAAGPAGNIFVTASWHPEAPITISMRDDGAGIPPDKMTRIFEPYYTSKSGGSGMGLAIVKHKTELYGGEIQVKSEAGNGAEFILTFPLKAIAEIHK